MDIRYSFHQKDLAMQEEKHLIFHQGAIPASCIMALLESQAGNGQAGAYGLFLGQVRADKREEGAVTSIHYTAYEAMAVEKMAAISRTVVARYPLHHFMVHHSLGSVAAGEVCFCVFTVSGHRRAALDACSELVELVKNEMPIWGKEYLAGASPVWKVNTES
jgi:molybdopterin synthase catalytic subunit